MWIGEADSRAEPIVSGAEGGHQGDNPKRL